MDARNATKIGISADQPAGPRKRSSIFTFLGSRLAATVLHFIPMVVFGLFLLNPPECCWRFKSRGLGTLPGLRDKDFFGPKIVRSKNGAGGGFDSGAAMLYNVKAPLLNPRTLRAQNAKSHLIIYKVATQNRGGNVFFLSFLLSSSTSNLGPVLAAMNRKIRPRFWKSTTYIYIYIHTHIYIYALWNYYLDQV